MPFSSRYSAMRAALAASPTITGTMGWSPGRIWRPRSVARLRKYAVFLRNLSGSSLDAERIFRASSDAATIEGATELEKRYGRDRWRRRAIRGLGGRVL